MFFSARNRGKTVGIDIGTTSVKTMEFSRSGRSLTVERYGYEPLAPGLVVENQIKDAEQIAQALQRALKRSGSKARRAAVCVTSNSVISKVVTIQSDLDDEELEALVEIEADRVVPYALDEVNIDYMRMGPSVNSAGEDDVQIVVCRKTVVEDLITVLQEVDLEPAVVDVDMFTLARVHRLVNQMSGNGSNGQTGALIDFGLNTSRLMVFHKGVMIYNRDTPFGGRQLIDSIQQKYGKPQDEAILSIRKNDLPDSYKKEVLKPFVRTLVQEILRSLQFFYSSTTHNRIDKLMLTGGCAQIGNIEKIVEKKVEVPTAVMNPFSKTAISSKVDKDRLRKDIPSLAIASGLALRGLE